MARSRVHHNHVSWTGLLHRSRQVLPRPPRPHLQFRAPTRVHTQSDHPPTGPPPARPTAITTARPCLRSVRPLHANAQHVLRSRPAASQFYPALATSPGLEQPAHPQLRPKPPPAPRGPSPPPPRILRGVPGSCPSRPCDSTYPWTTRIPPGPRISNKLAGPGSCRARPPGRTTDSPMPAAHPGTCPTKRQTHIPGIFHTCGHYGDPVNHPHRLHLSLHRPPGIFLLRFAPLCPNSKAS